MQRTATAVLAMAVLAVTVLAVTACGSGGGRTAPSSADRSGYVDGIRIPTPAPTTAIPVVPAPTRCPAAWRSIIARSESHGTVTVHADTSADLITCTYQDRQAAQTDCSQVTVIVNTEPNAFEAFNRWTVEQGQNSMWGHDPALQPVPVAHVGILAEWAPGSRTFETATLNTWVAVFLTCASSTPRQEPLAEALARSGLASTA